MSLRHAATTGISHHAGNMFSERERLVAQELLSGLGLGLSFMGDQAMPSAPSSEASTDLPDAMEDFTTIESNQPWMGCW